MLRHLLICAVLGAASASAAAGQLVIASSTDARHRAGAIIDGAEPLAVAEGASVLLIAQDGHTLRIDGPSRAAPDASAGTAPASMLVTLSRLLSRPGAGTTMAVFRGMPRDPATVVIDIDEAAERCVSADAAVRFTRLQASRAGELLLAPGGGPALRVAWPAGQREMAWPAGMPLRPDREYTASSSTQRGRELRLLTLPENLPSAAHEVAWMAERGCDTDANRALARLIR